MQGDDEGTTVVFCSRHTLDYFGWDDTDRDFIKIIATPERNGKTTDRIALLEMQ
jgi:hypothetical protein